MKKILIFSILVLSSGKVAATTVDAYLQNRQAVKKYEAKNYYPAYRDILKALQSDPMNPVLHLNLGRILEANEEFEKAEQAYSSALEVLPTDSKLRFQALFNLGVVLTAEKKIPQALSAYQAALEIEPESIETKTNIELLMQNQEGGGGGDGESDKKQDPKDQKGGGSPKDDEKKPDQEKRKQPKPFQSQELTPADVKKILDEIKNQEQGIRAKEYDKGAKDAPRAKDW